VKREAAGDRESSSREANLEASSGLRALLKTRRRVEFRDTDAAGIVHFSAFFFWMESAEHELMRSVGLHVFERHPDGSETSWPRVSVSCDYRSTARFGDELDIIIGVAAIGRTSVTYECVFEHNGRAVAEGRVVAVRCLMRPGSKLEPVGIPADIVARLTASDAERKQRQPDSAS
jgi:4-hydroxybenzoyl-CoA thioesterase/acyl-CoA thioester hydrolase